MKNYTAIKLKVFATAVASALLLSGCDYLVENAYDTTDNNSGIVSEAIVENVSVEQENVSDDNEQKTNEAAAPEVTVSDESIVDAAVIEEAVAEPKAYNENIKAEAPPFNASDIPEYSGSSYAEINNNVPFFTDYPDSSFAIYSPLDNLGRCGVAYANISTELMPTEKRGEIGSVRPSGWHTVKYNDLIKDLYLYNRCHLIGYQLTGENANERNLITGTRYMNTEGMEPFESRVANYISSRNAHVLYRVTPIFDGNDLLARGVLMEAYSNDDDGAGICFCVFCYNVQPGIGINYADGDSWVIEEAVTEAVTTEPEPVTEPETEPEIIRLEPVEPQEPIEREMPSEEKSQTYILNTNTKKFHYPSCSSVDSMKDKNKQEYTGSRDDIIAMGYDPCKRCYP